MISYGCSSSPKIWKKHIFWHIRRKTSWSIIPVKWVPRPVAQLLQHWLLDVRTMHGWGWQYWDVQIETVKDSCRKAKENMRAIRLRPPTLGVSEKAEFMIQLCCNRKNWCNDLTKIAPGQMLAASGLPVLVHVRCGEAVQRQVSKCQNVTKCLDERLDCPLLLKTLSHVKHLPVF